MPILKLILWSFCLYFFWINASLYLLQAEGTNTGVSGCPALSESSTLAEKKIFLLKSLEQSEA